jgi:5'-deoxynucleotidase YfbR-like HD superfamily hydrolase
MKDFVKKIVKLDNIRQWEEKDSVIKETVSQHSFKVAAIANYLLQKIQIKSEYIHKDVKHSLEFQSFSHDVLSYAIMHDFDESIINRDLPHPVKYNKYNGDKIREIINDYVNHEIEQTFGDININVSDCVKSFVKLCDWLALMTFVKRNINMGVQTFDGDYQYCIHKTNEKIDEISKFVKEKYEVDLNLDWFL